MQTEGSMRWIVALIILLVLYCLLDHEDQQTKFAIAHPELPKKEIDCRHFADCYMVRQCGTEGCKEKRSLNDNTEEG